MSSATIENFEVRLDSISESIENDDRRDEILEYIDGRRATGIKVSTLLANANVLRCFANFLGKPFDEATRRDLNAYVNRRTSTRVYRSYDRDGNVTETHRKQAKSDATMDHHKVILRGFYKWRNNGEYPECVSHLKTRTGRSHDITADRLISRDELAALIKAADEPRLRALVAFMWESGLRAGEIVALNVGSVKFDSLGAQVTIPNKAQGLKTGSRTVRVLPNESSPYLQTWLELHACKDDPDWPLFYGASRRNPRGRMLPSSLYAVIQTLAKRADIKRHIKPHDFRHTAATEKARLGYNEAQLRWYFGWSRTSDMPTHYVHLAGADYEAMMIEKHGLQVPNPKTSTKMHEPCKACGTVNERTNHHCTRCRRPFGTEVDPTEAVNDTLLLTVKALVEEALLTMENEV